MQNLPAEGTFAGDLLAIMLVGGPFVSVLLAALVPSRLAGFFLGVCASALVVGFGALKAMESSQEDGTVVGAAIFGSGGLALSVMAAAITAFGRAMAAGRGASAPGSESVDANADVAVDADAG